VLSKNNSHTLKNTIARIFIFGPVWEDRFFVTVTIKEEKTVEKRWKKGYSYLTSNH
jgi:hypothetical protein